MVRYITQLATNNVALKAIYPEHKWTPYYRFAFRHADRPSSVISKSQQFLFNALDAILPGYLKEQNYKYQHREEFATLKGKMFRYSEFDVS
jgi:hypothetical protein